MIDLHLHTTASDGRLSPVALVERAAAAGIRTLSVTDHDTVAALAEARRAADELRVTLVNGIEITAVHDGRDVHILGYFIDPETPVLGDFLHAQRERRRQRVHDIAERLARLGVAVDISTVLVAADHTPGTSIGRPAIARLLVAAGHATSIQDAFDRYLATGRAAFVPRVGPTPATVVEMIHAAKGLASMAHPGVTRLPSVLRALVGAGLDALEAHHSDHPPAVCGALRAFAMRHALLVTGGSDFHGDEDRKRPLGGVTLPAEDFERLVAAVQARAGS